MVSLLMGLIFALWAAWLYLKDQDWKFMAFVALFNNQIYLMKLVGDLT